MPNNTLHTCECGCGEPTPRTFRPGHDARYKAKLFVDAGNGVRSAWKTLNERGWLPFKGVDSRRFGVEIEFIHPRYGINNGPRVTAETIAVALNAAGIICQNEVYNHRTRDYWKLTTDGSVHTSSNSMSPYGLELVSPILSGVDGFRQIILACQILSGLGCKINSTCGLHVHHEVSDLTTNQIKNVVITYSSIQPVVNDLLSDSRRNNTFAIPYGTYDQDDIVRSSSLSSIASRFGRYRSINLTRYTELGAIEFRQHQGVLKAEKIIAWVIFGKSVIKAAKENTGHTIRKETVKQTLEALLPKFYARYYCARIREFGRNPERAFTSQENTDYQRSRGFIMACNPIPSHRFTPMMTTTASNVSSYTTA